LELQKVMKKDFETEIYLALMMELQKVPKMELQTAHSMESKLDQKKENLTVQNLARLMVNLYFVLKSEHDLAYFVQLLDIQMAQMMEQQKAD